MGKKKKQEFQEFRNNEKSAYKTLKIPLKTILLNRDTIQPIINNLVFEMNDLVIHSYQFIRLYILYCFTNNNPLLQYTSPQRKRESKAKCNQRILLYERKKNGIIEKETQLSFQNSKSVDYEKFKMYLVEKNKLNKETIEFYKRDTWRKMKFRQYSYGKKSIDTFLHKIKETFGENLLIGYGNWSRDTQMKFFMPTMNKGLRKLIHKKSIKNMIL